MKIIKVLLLTILFPTSCLFGHNIEVSLITCAPGSEIYELEGHTGLRVNIPGVGDYVANWGIFDFNTPNFVYRFTKGETDYMMAFEPTPHFLNRYAATGRAVLEQTVDLSDEEAEMLLNLMQTNALPENRTYRYNYIKDNCATRPFSLICRSVGDSLILNDSPEFVSFRDAMMNFHSNYPWYQFGIDLALGSDIDRQTTLRDEIFAPVRLAEIIRTAKRKDGRPIISSERMLVVAENSPVLPPTPFFLSPLFISFIVAAITLFLCIYSILHRTKAKIWTFILYMIFGLCGLVLTFLIFISSHEATGHNWLYLCLNPLPLIIALSLLIKRLEKLSYLLQIINFALVFILLIIAAAGIQHLNIAFYPLIVSDLMCSATYIYIYKCQKKFHN